MLEQLLFQFIFATHIASKVPEVFLPHGPTLKNTALKPPLPEKDPKFVAPYLTAKSALAYDIESGAILYQKNINEKRKIASIGKLMTAMVMLDTHALSERVIIPAAATQAEPVKVWFYKGEEVTVETLLYGLLIHSGNDAAVALAIHDSLSEKTFATKMNQKARDIGLQNTNFTNATGLDAINSYSTAYDILRMALKSLEYDFIRDAVRRPKMTVTSADGGIRHELETTNELLGNNSFHIYGLKTGSTLGAGESFVALADRNGRQIITVVLDSENRFQETKVLIDWIDRAYKFR